MWCKVRRYKLLVRNSALLRINAFCLCCLITAWACCGQRKCLVGFQSDHRMAKECFPNSFFLIIFSVSLYFSVFLFVRYSQIWSRYIFIHIPNGRGRETTADKMEVQNISRINTKIQWEKSMRRLYTIYWVLFDMIWSIH